MKPRFRLLLWLPLFGRVQHARILPLKATPTPPSPSSSLRSPAPSTPAGVSARGLVGAIGTLLHKWLCSKTVGVIFPVVLKVLGSLAIGRLNLIGKGIIHLRDNLSHAFIVEVLGHVFLPFRRPHVLPVLARRHVSLY